MNREGFGHDDPGREETVLDCIHGEGGKDPIDRQLLRERTCALNEVELSKFNELLDLHLACILRGIQILERHRVDALKDRSLFFNFNLKRQSITKWEFVARCVRNPPTEYWAYHRDCLLLAFDAAIDSDACDQSIFDRQISIFVRNCFDCEDSLLYDGLPNYEPPANQWEGHLPESEWGKSELFDALSRLDSDEEIDAFRLLFDLHRKRERRSDEITQN